VFNEHSIKTMNKFFMVMSRPPLFNYCMNTSPIEGAESFIRFSASISECVLGKRYANAKE
jgi:hypothetical protein